MATDATEDTELPGVRENNHTAEKAAPGSRWCDRRLLLLLGFLASFFVLGMATQWLVSGPAATLPTLSAENPPTKPAAGRLIDLADLSEERNQTMKRAFPISGAIVTLLVLALLGGLMAILYNGLVTSREQVNAGWAQVENVYQRRLDLVPLLVDAVRTYAEHERDTLNELTQARAQALQVTNAIGNRGPESEEQLQAVELAQGAVDSALGRLLAIVEDYPDLKASQNFLSLQDQIEGSENRVAMERRNYNELSRRYNTRLQTFPSNLVAELMEFSAKPYFQATPEALEGLANPFAVNES